MGMPAHLGGCRSGMDRGYWGSELPTSTLSRRVTGTRSIVLLLRPGSAATLRENELLGRCFVTDAFDAGGVDGESNPGK